MIMMKGPPAAGRRPGPRGVASGWGRNSRTDTVALIINAAVSAPPYGTDHSVWDTVVPSTKMAAAKNEKCKGAKMIMGMTNGACPLECLRLFQIKLQHGVGTGQELVLLPKKHLILIIILSSNGHDAV